MQIQNKCKQRLVKLIKTLISIPSFFGNGIDEQKIGQWLIDYLKKYPFLEIKKQAVENNRFNIIAKTRGQPKLLLAGHLDTVEPKQGWTKDQLVGTIEENLLYGLGAYDMKAGLATFLDALEDFSKIEGLTILLYCDEEYDLKGMKKFVASCPIEEKPLIAILAEPTNLKIWNAHRGLIEIKFVLQGKTGHASNPKSGRNAIDILYRIIDEVRVDLSKYEQPGLGIPSLNIAYFRGGLNQGRDVTGEVKLGRQGNNIADYAELVIDVRSTKPELRAQTIIDIVKELAKKEGVILLENSVRHDLGSLYTDITLLKPIEELAAICLGRPIEYLDGSMKGYGDGQLLQEKFGIPVFYLGPEGANPHAPDEWVNIDSLVTLRKIYAAIIEKYCLISTKKEKKS